jgi:hypothetical protein
VVAIKLPNDQAAFLLRMIAHFVDFDDVDYVIGNELQKSVVKAIEKSKDARLINDLAFNTDGDY